MNITPLDTANTKNSYKDHIVPSVVTAAIALSAAIPLTAALSSGTGSVANAAPFTASCSGASGAAGANSAANSIKPGTTSSSIHRNISATTGTIVGNGNNNSGNGNGNTNGSGAQANGNTQVNNGLVGVNAIAPVSILNESLNNNTILSNNDVSTIVAPVTNLLSTASTSIVSKL